MIAKPGAIDWWRYRLVATGGLIIGTILRAPFPSCDELAQD